MKLLDLGVFGIELRVLGRNNSIKKILLGSANGPAAPAAGKVSRMAAVAQASTNFETAGK